MGTTMPGGTKLALIAMSCLWGAGTGVTIEAIA
jgi:hypothetical protein